MAMLHRALKHGHLRAGWVAADDAFGMSPSLREGLSALGMRYVLNVPAKFTLDWRLFNWARNDPLPPTEAGQGSGDMHYQLCATAKNPAP